VLFNFLQHQAPLNNTYKLVDKLLPLHVSVYWHNCLFSNNSVRKKKGDMILYAPESVHKIYYCLSFI